MTSGLNRRRVLGGATAALTLPVLTACGGGEPGTAAEPTPTETASEAETPAESGAAATALAATSDIPVGGCAVFSEQRVVVTQPTEGDFKAFTSVCTHQGCTVSASSDGVIPCECHGSEFSIEDGSVVQGPATSPLDEVAISVQGDSITLA